MHRRQFIALLGGAAAARPVVARAQQLAGKSPRIGFLQRIRNENVVAFIQGLRDAGYVDGQSALIETRIYETTLDRLPDFAKELVDLKCDVIVAGSQYAFEAVMRGNEHDPDRRNRLGKRSCRERVGSESLGHPGGNFTGLFLDLPELSGKQIELLKEAAPTLSRLGVLWDSLHRRIFNFLPRRPPHVRQEFALHSIPIKRPEDFKGAFDRAARERIDGVVVLSSPLILEQRLPIAEWATKARLPTISLFTALPRAGGLMAYGPNLPDIVQAHGELRRPYPQGQQGS